jgi:hypothetical protein
MFAARDARVLADIVSTRGIVAQNGLPKNSLQAKEIYLEILQEIKKCLIAMRENLNLMGLRN